MRIYRVLLGVLLIGIAVVAPQLHGADEGRVYLPDIPPIRAVDDFVAGIGHSPQPPAQMRLSIPAIRLQAPVDRLVRLSSGEIEAPDQWDHVGWYSQGPAPGAPGVAMFLGHVDSHTGPAVFFHLHELQPGELVTVERDGVSTTFAVTSVTSYAETALPLQQLLVGTGPSKIVLLTCSGDFNRATGRYNDRLVVFGDRTGA